MKKPLKTIILILIFSISSLIFAPLVNAGNYLDIKIFTGYSINSFTFYNLSGKYGIYSADKKILDIYRNEFVLLKVEKDSIRITKGNKTYELFAQINISGTGMLNSFRIKPTNTTIKERTYDDDLILNIKNTNFQVINHVDIENYVAGVVQSEGGGSVKDNDFYLVQAIACRTYALNNMKKHAKEGFHLCDSVHCQLYQGKCKSTEILAATFKTAGDVIVDKQNKMISAAFHSNSGGQTINSENLWSISTSYLKSVVDTFSIKMPNATWEYKIPTANWLNYLADNFNYNITDPTKKTYALTFKQEQRAVFFADSIPLAIIRADLGLRSTWFSITEQPGNYLLFKGKGYGHGVGMSQQGAIRMAQLGYSYVDIIKFYYKDVNITNFEELNIK